MSSKNTWSSISILVLLVIIYSGGASIMHGSKQEVGISSSPTNAKISVDGQSHGNTPVVVNLKRKDSHMIQIKMNGYQTYETNITKSTSGWVWGNLVFGGLPGLAVDAITGGLYELSPENVQGELNRKSTASVNKHDQLYIKVVLEPNPNWKRVGTLTKATK